MRNFAVLAARLSGRPVFMREDEARVWAHRLLSLDVSQEDRPKGLKSLFARAKAAKAVEPSPSDMQNPQIGCLTPLWMGEPDFEGFGWVLKDNIAVVSVQGPLLDEGYISEWSDYMIAGYDTLSQTYDEAQNDPRVQGIFYRIKSPGGLASQGLPDLCAKIRASRASAGGSKPVYMFAEAAYSAAYWIFASGDRGYAPPIGGVGSIGAVTTHCDASNMYAKDGIVMTPIQFGAKKTDGASFKPLSEAAQADWQSEIDYLGNMFVDGVIAGRPNLSRSAVLATEAACYLAGNTDETRSGLALGLVDEIATEQVAFEALCSAVSTKNASGPRAIFQTPAIVRVTREPILEKAMTTKAAPSKDDPITQPDDGMEICETCNGTGEQDDGSDCPDCDGEGEVEISQGERVAAVPAPAAPAASAAPAATAETATWAKAIADSPEAKANPAAALAAINNGLTLEQFKGMAAVPAASSASETAIDRRMKGARRLAADAPVVENSIGSALVADAKAKRDAKTK